MAVHFLAPHPLFGRASNRLSAGYQQRSPYYWWWAYLRRNQQYLACCEQGGCGDLASLYADFGDVRVDDFRVWWTEGNRGARLFGERPLAIRFGELNSPAEWMPEWSTSDVLVLAVPMRVGKRRLQSQFAQLLDSLGDRHVGARSRPAATNTSSTAQYRLARRYTVQNLQTALLVYDDWVSSQALPKHERLSLWEIGKRHNINRSAAKLAESKLADERLDGRNVLSATVSRYLRQARRNIDAAASACFPAV